MGNHEYYGNSSAELSPLLSKKEPRWNAWRTNVQARGLCGEPLEAALADARPPLQSLGAGLLTLVSVDTAPWVKSYRKPKNGYNWEGLTPPVLPDSPPVRGTGQIVPYAPGAAGAVHAAASVAASGQRVPAEKAWAAWEQAQLAQLDAALSASSSRWTIVTGHHPRFSFSKSGSTPADAGTPEMAALWALLAAHGVPLYLNGHDHNTQVVHMPGEPTVFVTSGAGSKCSEGVKASAGLLYGYDYSSFMVVTLTNASATLSFRDLEGVELYQLTL